MYRCVKFMYVDILGTRGPLTFSKLARATGPGTQQQQQQQQQQQATAVVRAGKPYVYNYSIQFCIYTQPPRLITHYIVPYIRLDSYVP